MVNTNEHKCANKQSEKYATAEKTKTVLMTQTARQRQHQKRTPSAKKEQHEFIELSTKHLCNVCRIIYCRRAKFFRSQSVHFQAEDGFFVEWCCCINVHSVRIK